MLEIAGLMLLKASISEVPKGAWRCRNQVEVWCAADGCAATDAESFTPIDATAEDDGALSVCLYSGCFDGKAKRLRSDGRSLWLGDGLKFVSSFDGASGDVTLLIIENDGVGFVRAGGLATPVLCAREGPLTPDAGRDETRRPR